VTRARNQTYRRPAWTAERPWAEGGALPDPPATPVPPAELLDRAGEIRSLVDELVELTGCGDAWGVRVLRRNVELALLNPATLGSADNQLDFIEELAGTAWDGADAAFGQTVARGESADEAVRREERRRAAAERLGELAHELCAAAEAWRDLVVATAEAAAAGVRNPQDDHSF
jgi:hypothetical protein